jgi:hypothetical protein
MQEDYNINTRPDAHILPSGATTPRPIGSNEDDDRSTLVVTFGDTSSSRVSSSREPEHSEALAVNESPVFQTKRGDRNPIHGQTHLCRLRRSKRVWIRICKIVKDGFRFEGGT